MQLKHIPTGIVVTCQETRSQEQNRKIAREILAMKVQHALDPENSRESVVREWKRKKAASKRKKAKRKYRKLEEEKQKKLEEEGGASGDNKSPIADALTNAIVNSVD